MKPLLNTETHQSQINKSTNQQINERKKRSLSDYSIISLKGMAMGTVELLPGISGGTIAFVTGVYEELLDTIKGALPALKQLFGKKSFKQRIFDFWAAVNGNFVVALILGIAIAMVATASIVNYTKLNYPIPFYAFVFGLIMASVVLVYKKVWKWTWGCYLLGIVGMCLALLLPIQPHDTTTIVPLWYLFICACLASCAFILPGTSGAFVLLLMGAYNTFTTAIGTLNITHLAVIGAGCLTGLISFSSILSWLLKKYHDWLVALLTGFIVGSLKIIWPWKTTIYGKVENTLPNDMITEAIIACIAGIVIVLGIEFIANFLNKKKIICNMI